MAALPLVPTVRQWLESILLTQYEDILISNGYDTVYKCCKLTGDELERLGITRPGHKKRILSHLLPLVDEPPCPGVSRQTSVTAAGTPGVDACTASDQLASDTSSDQCNNSDEASHHSSAHPPHPTLAVAAGADKWNGTVILSPIADNGTEDADSEMIYSNVESSQQSAMPLLAADDIKPEPKKGSDDIKPEPKKRMPIPTPRRTISAQKQDTLQCPHSAESTGILDNINSSTAVDTTADSSVEKAETLSLNGVLVSTNSMGHVMPSHLLSEFESNSQAPSGSGDRTQASLNGIPLPLNSSLNGTSSHPPINAVLSQNERSYSSSDDAKHFDEIYSSNLRSLTESDADEPLYSDACHVDLDCYSDIPDPFDYRNFYRTQAHSNLSQTDAAVAVSVENVSLGDTDASDLCLLINDLDLDDDEQEAGANQLAVGNSNAACVGGRESYVQLWHCNSPTEVTASGGENGIYSLETVPNETHEEVHSNQTHASMIVSDTSTACQLNSNKRSSSSSSSSCESFSVPPLPPKRSDMNSTSDQIPPRQLDAAAGPTVKSVPLPTRVAPSAPAVANHEPKLPSGFCQLPPVVSTPPLANVPKPTNPHNIASTPRTAVEDASKLRLAQLPVVNSAESGNGCDSRSGVGPIPASCPPPIPTPRSAAFNQSSANSAMSRFPVQPKFPQTSTGLTTCPSPFDDSIPSHPAPRAPIVPPYRQALPESPSGAPAPSNVLNKIRAIGGVNVLNLGPAGCCSPPANSHIDSPLTPKRTAVEAISPSAGNSSSHNDFLPIPGARLIPKVTVQLDQETANNDNPYCLATAMDDDDTGDEELNLNDDAKNTSFADSDGGLSDGGEFYGLAFQRPSTLTAAIPIVKAAQTKWTERKGYLFKFETEPRSVARLGTPWKKFWVTFDGSTLKYFSSNKSFVSRRIIPVSIMLNIDQDIKVGEVHSFRFRLSTIDRVYTFAAEDANSLSLWSSIIMQAIIEAKVDADNFVEGGEMCDPIMQGFVRMEGIRGKVYLAIKKFRLCCYKTVGDYKTFTPIHQVEMQTASVKELNRNRLQLYTPHVAFVFQFESSEELNRWKSVFEHCISHSLGDDAMLNEVYKNSSNRFCADCNAADPDWASVSLGITICKHCAGVHRSMSVSKVRSLRMDFKVWKPSVLQLMVVIGNSNANTFWESKAVVDGKIDTSTDDSERKRYIYNKYQSRVYCNLHPLHDNQSALNEALCKSVQFGDLLQTMQLVFSGAETHCLGGPCGNETPLQLAQKANQTLQMEFLYQNSNGRITDSGTSTLYEVALPHRTIEFSHRGYLMKTGSNTRGDFRRRWCTLENGVLSYFDSEKSTVATCSVDKSEMLGVRITADDRVEFAFELATTKNNGRVFLFAADSSDERMAWMLKLAKTMARVDADDLDRIVEFNSGGNVFMRIGATADWHSTWIHLIEKTLYIYNQDEQFVEYDLRKALSVAFVQQTEKCLEAFDDGPPVVVDMPNGRALYIQSDTGHETESWLQVLQKTLLDVTNTLSSQPLSTDNVPLTVEKCTNFVATYGLQVEGIYRISGQHSKVSRLLEQLSADSRSFVLKNDEYQVHDVATVLRRFIRGLNEPLLTNALRPRWIQTAGLGDDNTKLQWYKYLLGELPRINYSTLKRIVTHLARISELEQVNKMSAINLASIFGPILMNVDQPGAAAANDCPMSAAAGFEKTREEIIIVKDLIDHHRLLFGVKDEELEHERKIEEAAKKIERLISHRRSKPVEQDDMLIGVHINSYDGDVVSHKVSSKLHAHELLAIVLDKAKLDSSSACWALFEVICDGQLERPIHSMELVVDVTLKWAAWPAEFCHNAHLCLKHNYVYEAISTVTTPQMSLFCELRYADKKSYRKYSFEFSRYSLSYRSSSKAAVPTAMWNIEDLVVYVGLQQQRSPPTKWGFTFYVIADQLTSPYFGHSVCCGNEQELYRWLAAMLCAQHPEGLLPNGPNGSQVVQRNTAAASATATAAAAANSPTDQLDDFGHFTGAGKCRKFLNRIARR